MRHVPLFIDGVERDSTRSFDVNIPFDGTPFASMAEASAPDVEDALAAATRAAVTMRGLTAADRSAILRRAHGLLIERKQEFAHAIASESGKPLREARLEADRGAQTLLFSAEEANRLAGDVVPMEAAPNGKGRMALTVREPLGVIAAITPFNFPLNLSVHKIGPALAAGNAVVHKPASATPVSAYLLAMALRDSGLPPGALNVVAGPGATVGAMLTSDPRVAMITFTGSADVGLALRQKAALKRVTLELGNNSALIVERDADLSDCVRRAVPGAYAHSGQVCISVQRIFVHNEVAGEFRERFVEAARALRVGNPLEEATDVSSLITEAEAGRVEEWIAEAVRSGARLLTGGTRDRSTVQPAVLDRVPLDARVSCQEAFGPLVCIHTYGDLEEAIQMVNLSDYGLQAGIFTNDLEKAFRAARRVHVGGFLINDVPQFRADQMPYGGVKRSGVGREGPHYAIEEMTEPKLISWRVD